MTRNIIFLTSIFGFQPLIFQGVHFLNDDFSGSPESQEFGSLSDGVLILKNGFFRGLFINYYRLNHDNHDVSFFLGLLFQSQTEK